MMNVPQAMMDVNILAIIYLVPMNVAVVKGTSKLENITAKILMSARK